MQNNLIFLSNKFLDLAKMSHITVFGFQSFHKLHSSAKYQSGPIFYSQQKKTKLQALG